MPYKISGSKSETARIVILKESDWSIESNTVVSGSGSYEIEDLESGNKLIFARTNDGWIEGYGSVGSEYYTPPARGIFAGGQNGTYLNIIDYITISTIGDAADFGDLTVARSELSACSNGPTDRGVFSGGKPTTINVIDYIAISTTSDASDFGDLTVSRTGLMSCSNNTNDRGIFGGGDGILDVMDYVTISITANANDFGDLIGREDGGSTSNGTNNRGVFGGGRDNTANPTNSIEYITISSLGNSTDFGDLLLARGSFIGTCSNLTGERGIFAGGFQGTNKSEIYYITINSTGNAQDFGDLTAARSYLAGTSNGINNRGVFAGGGGENNTIDYITISSTGNALDFGDLTQGRQSLTATSNA